MIKPADMFQRTPRSHRKVSNAASVPLCNASPKPMETRSSGLGPCLSAGYHQTALWQDLTWITAAGWNPTSKFSLYFGKGKHGPEGCGSCRQGRACQLDHLCSSDCAHIAFLLVLLLPGASSFLSVLLNLDDLPFSFVLSWFMYFISTKWAVPGF